MKLSRMSHLFLIMTLTVVSYFETAQAQILCPAHAAKEIAEAAAVMRYLNDLDSNDIPGSVLATLYNEKDDEVFGISTSKHRLDPTKFVFKVSLEGITQKAGDAVYLVVIKQKECQVTELKLISQE